MFNMFKKTPEKQISGMIGYFNLSDWWLLVFSEDEREYILNKYQPLGSSDSSLIKGEISSTDETAISLLSALAGWFRKEEDRKIGYKILEKAEEMVNGTRNILDIHFLYQVKSQIYYRNRNVDLDAFEKAIEACKQQIEIAPKAKRAFLRESRNCPLPSHRGFEQLSIIEEKRGNYAEAIKLSKTALKQGWAGSWEKRIERYQKKLLA